MREKVVIIGAGTSGLIAAKRLAALDIDTTVYERLQRPGYPPKASGIVSIDGLNSLEIKYKKAITNTLYGANIHAGKTVLKMMADEPKAHVLDRVFLNELCCAEAEGSGARVRKGERVDDKKLDSLHSENILIGADGPVSMVARHFKMGPLGRHVLTYKAEFDVDVPDSRVVDVFLDNKITPGFFAWLCPDSKDVLEVGVGIDPKHGNSRAAFDRFVKLEEIVEVLGGNKMLSGYASLIPMGMSRRIVNERQEVLLIGDAAGHIKETTGGGIVFGGNAALIAAEAISKHIKSGKSLTEYENLFNKRFGKDLFLHSLAKGIYSSLSTSQIALLMRVTKLFGIEGFLSEYGDMDQISVIVKRFFTRRKAQS